MSLLPRLDAAIKKIDAKIVGIPLDERVPENLDYTKHANVVQSLRQFRIAVEKMEDMLDKLGV